MRRRAAAGASGGSVIVQFSGPDDRRDGGTVALRSARNADGKTQSGRFNGGVFQVLQSRKRAANRPRDPVDRVDPAPPRDGDRPAAGRHRGGDGGRHRVSPPVGPGPDELLAETAQDEQRVVDRDPDADHRDDGEHERVRLERRHRDEQ